MSVIAGKDKNDTTCADINVPDYLNGIGGGVKGIKIGIPREYFAEGLDADVRTAVDNSLKIYERLGAKLVEVSLPHTEYAVAVYYIVANAEASSNLSRFDGVRYGFRANNIKALMKCIAGPVRKDLVMK